MQKTNSTRREFLKSASLVSIGFVGLQNLGAFGRLVASPLENPEAGFGPLKQDPNGVFNLPKGFSYKIITRMGEKMDDGFLSPGLNDGMASFPGKNGRVIIVRNHEVTPGDNKNGAYGKKNEFISRLDTSKNYDAGNDDYRCLGGTSTIVYNESTQEVEKQYMSLTGTIRNCAGGPTPWGSWITCEETTLKKGQVDGALTRDHGYNFEVPASENPELVDPVPLKDMGRFNHEAVTVHPETGIVYQSEDRDEGLIYRFLPNEKGDLKKGGKLQALAIKDAPSRDTRNWPDGKQQSLPKNSPMQVEWIDMENIQSPEDDLRYRGFDQGAARFARGEGMWFGKDEFYFACTNGGHKQQGQVFRYRPSPSEGTSDERDNPGTLELFAEPNDSDLLRNCDNLTVAPWGDVLLCEDRRDDPRIVGITPEGKVYQFAENIGYPTELAGIHFSPSGKTMFVNIQEYGLTLAITGDWKA